MSKQIEDNPITEKSPWNMGSGLLIGLGIGALLGTLNGDLLEGIGFGLVIGLAIGAAFERRGRMMQFPPGMLRRVILCAGLFLIVLLGSQRLLDLALARPLQIAVTLAPALAFLLLVLSVAAAIASLDELQRRIQTEAIAIGFGFTAVFAVTYGLLAGVGLSQANWIFISVPMAVGWALGKFWTVWKYG